MTTEIHSEKERGFVSPFIATPELVGLNEVAAYPVAINKTIFDVDRAYVSQTGSVFLNGNPGLLDSINKRLPEIWAKYKKLKTLDWDENEQLYKECAGEFLTADPSFVRMMVMTLAWQWESDSIAAHHVLPILAPFNPCAEVWIAYGRIGDNENLHGLTYSEIVKNSFEGNVDVIEKMMAELEPLKRLSVVANVFAQVKQIGAELTLGLRSQDDPEVRDAIMLFMCTLFCMERIQFMVSFGVTFAMGENAMWVPIAKIVQKICNDEFNIHVEVARLILRNELATEVGMASYLRIKPQVETVIANVVQGELDFTNNFLFADGKQLPGCNAEVMCEFARWCATDVYNEFPGIVNPFGNVTENPLGYMDDWVDMDKNQGAPQEEKTVNYLLGGTTDSAPEEIYSIAGL